MVESGRARWRRDIDALAFEPDGHRSVCVVHRLAFRSLLRLTPTPEDCLAYFAARECAFRTAAQGKIARRRIKAGVSFHLTSRDLSRALAVAK
jgi:hypothetical protein